MKRKKTPKKVGTSERFKIETRESLNTRTYWVIVFSVALFGFLLYANTINHGYVLDDFSVVKENFVTKQGLAGIPTHFETHARYGYWPGPGELYRPIPMSMFSIEWALAPDQPWVSHLVNVLLYALTGAVLFILLLRLFKGHSMLLPLLSTLFFVAHPVHVEVVANIKSRDEIMMLLFSLLAILGLLNYHERKKIHWLLLSMFCYLIALFSKESAVTFVAVFPLVLFFFSKEKLKRHVTLTIPFAALALLFILVRKSVIGAFGNPGDVAIIDNFLVGANDLQGRLSGVFLLLGKYLWTLLFPISLASDYGYNQIPIPGWGDWRVWLSFFAWVGIAGFGLLRLRGKNIWSFSILFFIITFSISSNLLMLIGTSYGERLLYAASPGFAIALTLLLMHFTKANSAKLSFTENKTLWLVAIGILSLYSLRTVVRNLDWKDSYTLYEADIETSPNSAKLNFHYGLEIVQRGLNATDEAERKLYLDRSKAQFQKAISIWPTYHDAYGQLGLAHYRDREYDEALRSYEQAIKYKNNFPLVYSNMGIIFFEKGDLVKARECYENAVKYDPRMVDAQRNLGVVNALEGKFDEAIRCFSEALKYAPDDPTINFYIGSAYRDSGREALGQPYLEKAYRLNPALKK